MHKNNFILGIDIGSVTVKAVLLTSNQSPLIIPGWRPSTQLQTEHISKVVYLSDYIRHQGRPLHQAEILVNRLIASLDLQKSDIRYACTGRGGKMFASLLGRGVYINDFKALAAGTSVTHPNCETVFELGGEQARYLHLKTLSPGDFQIVDYEKNGDCAAGTGSFFDQQAGRLHIDITSVSDIIATANRSAHIAGRCSVFAKSDMIHAQQNGYRPEEVLKGLCDAVVRNYKGSITKGKDITLPVLVAGGISLNGGVVDALKNAYNLDNGQLLVHDEMVWLSALGAALSIENSAVSAVSYSDHNLQSKTLPRTESLALGKVRVLTGKKYDLPDNGPVVKAYLGIDIGSVSTNLALLDDKGHLIDGIYTMTKGRPVETVTEALAEMGNRVGDRVKICGVGTTGSGRELIGMLVGADTVKDEITAHKTGALKVAAEVLDRPVDTIFEIGGQDAKFIALRDGVVVDFTLNEACAAGTGSFLEEQATELGINIKNEFADLALSSPAPLKMGERCTVFMEKELKPYLNHGIDKESITAGLAYSVVQNYLNRVVKKRPIGDVIFFQGGTAYNRSVAAAFATILNKEIIVPPHNGIMGAIGAALLAGKKMGNNLDSRFKGWALDSLDWSVSEIKCQGCDNHCIVQQFSIDGEKSYWGDKCSTRFRKPAKTDSRPVAEDLFALHENYLNSDGSIQKTGGRGRVLIPMVMQFWDRKCFWERYFELLHIDVVFTGPSSKRQVDDGIATAIAEPCFPIQMAHGHVATAELENVDWLFIPNVVNEIDPTDSVASFICPWAQTLPLVMKQSPTLSRISHKLWHPNIQFREGRDFNENRMWLAVSEKWPDITRDMHQKAWLMAESAYESYHENMQAAGSEALTKIAEAGRHAILLLGRPYNLYDSGLNLNIPGKLRSRYGIDVIPMDCLPLNDIDISDIHDHMFWNYGRKIIQAAKLGSRYQNLHVVYLSNFKCGPDSYIRHYIEDALKSPYLFLQLDSHANDAGVLTRLEAFLESKLNQ